MSQPPPELSAHTGAKDPDLTSGQKSPPPVERDGELDSSESVQVRCVTGQQRRYQSILLNLGLSPTTQVRLVEAEELKQDGNGLFRLNRWNEALERYRSGLARLPKRCPPAPPATTHNEESDPPQAAGGVTSGTPTKVDGQPTSSASANALERECAKTRSVLNANIAACHVKLVRVHARGSKAGSIL
jgi:hypothetical protein